MLKWALVTVAALSAYPIGVGAQSRPDFTGGWTRVAWRAPLLTRLGGDGSVGTNTAGRVCRQVATSRPAMSRRTRGSVAAPDWMTSLLAQGHLASRSATAT